MGDAGDVPIPGQAPPPPPSSAQYLQYGVAFTGDFTGFLSSPGNMCDGAVRADGRQETTCILSSGGGIVFPRVGWRPGGPWYFGGAYAASKQDPNKLYRLAILQQLRAEARYYFRPELQTQPFLNAGLGVAGYGNEWKVDTWGPLAVLGFGLEAQISRRTVVSLGLNYRAVLFSKFTDTSGAIRPAGIATLIGIELALEGRDPI